MSAKGRPRQDRKRSSRLAVLVRLSRADRLSQVSRCLSNGSGATDQVHPAGLTMILWQEPRRQVFPIDNGIVEDVHQVWPLSKHGSRRISLKRQVVVWLLINHGCWWCSSQLLDLWISPASERMWRNGCQCCCRKGTAKWPEEAGINDCKLMTDLSQACG
jgi:hypothetical protein